MADKEWQNSRPTDWDKTKHDICGCEFEPDCDSCPHNETVEKIASAMLKAVIVHLNEPCPHGLVPIEFTHIKKKDCPQCWSELCQR